MPALPGERCTLAPVALRLTIRMSGWTARITATLDASLRAPGPHGFAVRSFRLRKLAPPDLGAVRSARSTTSRGLLALVRFTCPSPPRPPHPGPRSLRRTIAPLPGPGWTDHAVIPKFGKVEYFCGGGIDGISREAGVLPDGSMPVEAAMGFATIQPTLRAR
jgi:hypothetical protein